MSFVDKPCEVRTCQHARDSHHKEIVSSTDATKAGEREAQYFACLASFCTCTKYKPTPK